MQTKRMGSMMLVLASAGCGAPATREAPGGEVGALYQAIGEPQSGFPTPDERLGLMAINRARSDPSTVKGPQSTVFPARPPVLWNYDLSRSSRFHAINLQQTRTSLMHTSPCKLNANVSAANCSGAPACACATAVPQSCASCANVAAENNCGTPPFTRIAYFSNIATGEVAAAGYADTWAAVDGWVTEPAGADGHRRNLLDQGIVSNTMGFGRSTGAGCYTSFDISDSGMQNGLAIPLIPTAGTNPSAPGAGTVRVYATWADPNLGAPQALYAVVDGQCTAMKKELGSPTLNSTWYADVAVAAKCSTWYVLGFDGAGARTSYPTTGALSLSVGGVACANDYTAQAPAAACDGAAAPPDLSMSGGAHDLAMRAGVHDLAVFHGAGDDPGQLGGSGAVGDVCHAHADCASGICAFSSNTAGECTAACDPTDPASCPSGFTCGIIDGDNFCVRPTRSGQGCSVAHTGAPWDFLLIALALPVLRLTRRRRSSTL